MTRSRALGLAAVVLALVWVTGYLLRRRAGRSTAPELTPQQPTSPAVTAPAAPPPRAPAPPQTAAVAPPAAAVAPPVPAPGPRAEPRSWDSGRVPRTPPRPIAVPQAGDALERQLPTWLRVLIVAAALLAFFAISLIATKQV